jgi:hypothetical protein
MPRIDKIDVWIEATEDKTRYEEHKVSIEGNKKAECFIESKAGAGFTIVCEVDHDYKYHGKHDMWILCTIVDGRWVDGKCMRKDQGVIRIRGAKPDATSLIPFEFGETQFTGDSFAKKLTFCRRKS